MLISEQYRCPNEKKVPSRVTGQTKQERSRHLVKRHSPSRSAHSIFTIFPLRPRKTKICPENWSSFSIFWTFEARALKPQRISVTPATSQIRVPDGRDIIVFSRSTRGLARSATLMTGFPASFCRGGTQHDRKPRWRERMRTYTECHSLQRVTGR